LVIERGRHGDLLQNNGHYARLWWMQAGLTAEEAKSLKTGRTGLQNLSVLESEAMEADLMDQEAA
jgi:hypothetical protein